MSAWPSGDPELLPQLPVATLRRLDDGHTLPVRANRPGAGGAQREFADICTSKGIWRTGPLPPERAGRDQLDLKRLALEFDRRSHGRLRMLIDTVNRWPSSS